MPRLHQESNHPPLLHPPPSPRAFVPSGEKATEYTQLVCPSSRRSSAQLAGSPPTDQTRTEVSYDPLTTSRAVKNPHPLTLFGGEGFAPQAPIARRAIGACGRRRGFRLPVSCYFPYNVCAFWMGLGGKTVACGGGFAQ